MFVYGSVGEVRSEYKTEPVGSVQGGGRAHPHVSVDLAHRWKTKNKERRGQLPEEPKKGVFLGRHWVDHIGPKDKVPRKAVETCKQRRGEISK